MTTDDNKAIIRRGLEEMFSRGNVDVADEVFAADHVGHDPAMPQDLHGPEEFKHFVRMYRTAFPDLELRVEDQIAEGDEVVTRFTAHGTHRGELMGIAPTDNEVEVAGISIDRLVDGKSVESWTSYDMLGMLRQLGALATQAAADEASAAEL